MMEHVPAILGGHLILLILPGSLAAQGTFLISLAADTTHTAHSIAAAPDGGHVIAGIHDDATPSVGLALTKVDAQGSLQWSKRYAPVPFQDIPEVLPLTSGGMLLLSSTYPMRDLLLLRVDDAGDTLWTRVLNSPIIVLAKNAVELPGGDIVVASYTHQRFYLTRITDLGSVVWSYGYAGGSLPSATVSDQRADIKLTSDGTLIACGALLTDGPLESNDLILKVDLNGGLLWGRFIGGDDEDNFRSVVETDDGGYLAIGYHSPTANAQRQMVAIRLDGNGSVLWRKRYPTNETTICRILEKCPDGNYVIGGGIHGSINGHEGLLFKINDQGDVLWSNAYGPDLLFYDAVRVNAGLVMSVIRNAGLPSSAIAAVMAQDTIGATTCTILPYPLTAVDLTLAESAVVNPTTGLNPAATNITVSPLPLTPQDECPSNSTRPTEAPMLELHPNPASGQCFIRSDASGPIAYIDIWDARGRPVMQLSAPGPGPIDISSLPPGLFLVRAFPGGGSPLCAMLAVE